MSRLSLTDLDAAAKDVQTAQRAAMIAEVHATPGQTDTPQEAALYAKQAIESCVSALTRLRALGADIPTLTGRTSADGPTVPLELLDTPATRRLLASLEEAAQAGAEVDRERGWMMNGQPTGYGETLGEQALALRTEIYGPQTGRE